MHTPVILSCACTHSCHQVTAEEAERRLRDLVFTRWQGSGCEGYEDTLKLTSLVGAAGGGGRALTRTGPVLDTGLAADAHSCVMHAPPASAHNPAYLCAIVLLPTRMPSGCRFPTRCWAYNLVPHHMDEPLVT